MNGNSDSDFDGTGGSPMEGLDKRQGGNGGGSHAVQSREEKGMGGVTEVTPFKLCDGTVWRGVGGGGPTPATRGRRPTGSGPVTVGAGRRHGSATWPVQNRGGEVTETWALATVQVFKSVELVKNWSNKFEFKF
jgi:hypothetical protein